MAAAVVRGPRAVAVDDVPVPTPGDGQVLVRIEGCGVCGSNVPVWEGRPWLRYPLPPGEPGHEAWGVVETVGAGVDPRLIGTRVAALTYRSFAPFDVAEADAVVPLPPELEHRPFPGEALGCAVNVFRRAAIVEGERVAVVGVGFLGALLVQLAARAGATVTAVARRAFARGVATRCGASSAVTLEAADGEFDCVVEAAGAQVTLDVASRLVRVRGRLVIAGYHQDGRRSVDMTSWNWRGLDVVNAHERDPRVYVEGMRAAVEAVAAGQLDVEPLITHRYPLNRLGDALEAARLRPERFLKAVVLP